MKIKAHFLEIKTGFNIPSFKNDKRTSRTTHRIWTEPKTKKKMEAMALLLRSSSISQSVEIGPVTLITWLQRCSILWLMPGEYPRTILKQSRDVLLDVIKSRQAKKGSDL